MMKERRKKRRAQRNNAAPKILVDYCFVRRDDETETVTILLMKDRYSRANQAWVVDERPRS